jgi:hypothetical protein
MGEKFVYKSAKHGWVVIVVDDENVWLKSFQFPGLLGGPSGVDYYYSERGYGCKTTRDVADQYYINFVDAEYVRKER